MGWRKCGMHRKRFKLRYNPGCFQYRYRNTITARNLSTTNSKCWLFHRDLQYKLPHKMCMFVSAWQLCQMATVFARQSGVKKHLCFGGYCSVISDYNIYDPVYLRIFRFMIWILVKAGFNDIRLGLQQIHTNGWINRLSEEIL